MTNLVILIFATHQESDGFLIENKYQKRGILLKYLAKTTVC